MWATGGEGGRLTLSAASVAASVFRGAGCPPRAPSWSPIGRCGANGTFAAQAFRVVGGHGNMEMG